MLFACSKSNRAHKKLNGTFQIVEYRYQSPEGFSYFPTTTGSVFFESHEEADNAYSLSISYSHPQINGSRTEAGIYTINDEVTHLMVTPIVNGSKQDVMNHAIHVLTQNDLKIEYLDSLGARHFYVFEK